MKLSEIKGNKEQLDLPLFIAVPRGTLWQKAISNCWVFDRYDDAVVAAFSEKAQELVVKTDGRYLPYYRIPGGAGVLLMIKDEDYQALPSGFQVLAVGPSEKSCRAAAEKRHNGPIWCYRTWNSNPDFFKDDEE